MMTFGGNVISGIICRQSQSFNFYTFFFYLIQQLNQLILMNFALFSVPDRGEYRLLPHRVALGQTHRELPGVRRLAPEENLPAALEEDPAAAPE